MTLGRQLLVGITAAFLVLLVVIEAIYVSYARHYLEEQLDAHANETATSLSLTIGSRVQAMDAALVNTIVNPVFDRGHFESIEVKSSDGATVLARRLEQHDISVPDWFEALIGFDAPTGRALISSGWRQLGQVVVRVHPQYAYEQLWDTALATLAWLGVLFAAALAAMRVYLSGILKPLSMIEQSAIAIGNRDFVSIDVKPRARELQQVTQAINSLSAKIRDAIAQEGARAERLRREAFEDPTTGRLNRRGFENTVSAAIANSAEVHTGALALFTLAGLEEINRAVGLTKGNQVLKQLSDALSHDAPALPLVGRWQGPTLAAFLANVGRDPAGAWADALCRDFVASLRASGLPQSVTVSGGVAHFSAGATSLASLGKLAEATLAQALARGAGALCTEIEGTAQPRDMKAEIEAALSGGRVSLLFQKVASIPDDGVLHFEFFGNLVDSQGAAISGATFVPVAGQYGLLPALDRRVAELGMAALAMDSRLPETVSINVATQSVLDEGFRAALRRLLEGHPAEARRLVFEITGASASKSPEMTRDFARELARFGSRLALDNFEMDRSTVALVHELMPSYVKLAPVYTREIGEREDARFILEALLRAFQPLEIPVIAQGVEDRTLVALLAAIGVSGYQGYVLGKPEPL